MKATLPLLALVSGRKPRATRARTVRPKEIVLHMAVAKILRDHCLPEWQWFHVPSGELRDIRTASKLKQMGVKPGIPDILLIPPTGRIHCLELKRQGEMLSDAQEDFQCHAIKHGWPHSVADSFDQALAVLDAWGCLRLKIGPARGLPPAGTPIPETSCADASSVTGGAS
jgi:hypothetical protein